MAKDEKKKPKAPSVSDKALARVRGRNPRRSHANASTAIGPLGDDADIPTIDVLVVEEGDGQEAPPVRPGSIAAAKHEKANPTSVPSVGGREPAKLTDDKPAMSKPGDHSRVAYGSKTPPEAPALALDDAMVQSIIGQIIKTVTDTLHEGGDDLLEAYKTAGEIHDEEQGDDDANKKFRYNASISISIQRKETPGDYIVTAALGFNVKRRFDKQDTVTDPRVAGNMPMFDKKTSEVS